MGIAFAMLLVISLILPGRASAAQPPTEEVTPPAFDPGAPPKTRILLAPFLTFGGRLELEYQLEKNFDLDNSDDDELSTLEPELSLAFSFDPSRNVQAYLNVSLLREIALTEGRERSERERQVRLELKHAFVLFKDLFDGRLSLQVGRQRFRDNREWLYDDELDAVRAYYRVSKLSLELSVSRKDLVDRDLLNREDNERINNYFLYGRYALTEKVAIAAYTFFRDDRSSERERPIFFGLQSNGEIVDDLEYWLELAHVRGKDGSKRIRGWGLDLGATYEFDSPLRPSITVGYAFGTGDGDPDDRVDRSFRQTGLQGNEDKFNGVTRFKYYGELFDPELSNLSIFTGGFGIRPTRRSSIDLVYHYYLQHKASETIREAEIDEEPTGPSKRLGSEIDLIVGYREIRNVDLALTLGYFIPDKAFPSGADNAFFANLKIRYSF